MAMITRLPDRHGWSMTGENLVRKPWMIEGRSSPNGCFFSLSAVWPGSFLGAISVRFPLCAAEFSHIAGRSFKP